MVEPRVDAETQAKGDDFLDGDEHGDHLASDWTVIVDTVDDSRCRHRADDTVGDGRSDNTNVRRLVVLQSATPHHQADWGKERRDAECPETIFWFKVASVPLGYARGNPVADGTADGTADDSGDDILNTVSGCSQRWQQLTPIAMLPTARPLKLYKAGKAPALAVCCATSQPTLTPTRVDPHTTAGYCSVFHGLTYRYQIEVSLEIVSMLRR